jgi:hypothetical protein
LLALVAFTIARLEASLLEVPALDLELDGPGRNVDDPCFWVDPADPAGTLIFITTKDETFIEVFNVVSGEFVATIPGFGRPNNCAVEGDLLLTTDRDHNEVTVHHIPDLALIDAFGQDMTEPEGIDVLDLPGGQKHVYVTDSADASVHVYDLATRDLVRAFPTGFGAGIEPIYADDYHQRIFVARGEKEATRGVGLFDPEGQLILEFGLDVFRRDAEGIAVYACGDGGYLVIADQVTSATEFEVFDRVTLEHIGTFTVQDGEGDFINSTDGIDILQTPLPNLPSGVLAACDGCGSTLPDEMDVVSWDRIASTMGLDVCPNGVEPDCIGTPCTERIAVAADAHVDATEPGTNFGDAEMMELELDPPAEREIFLRFVVPDLTGFELLDAVLQLSVASPSKSSSDDGGTLYITSGAWTEDAVTYDARPASLGAPIASVGPVAARDRVELDVSAVVTGGGTFDFMLRSSSADKALYSSREGGAPATLVLALLRDNPPTVSVTGPSDGTSIEPGTSITLSGNAADGNGTDLSGTIAWRSDLDGDLGQGASVTVSTLSVGTHEITAEVADEFGVTAVAMVSITVNTSPTVSITAPAVGAQVPAGQSIALVASATDAEDGDLSATISWQSSQDGLLGSGSTFTVNTLSAGPHVLTAAVVDSAGTGATAQRTITIIGPPVVDIIAPADGASVSAETPVPLLAAAVDATDGDLSSAVTWLSDRDGPLGTGASIAAMLSEGAHVVSASVQNSQAVVGQAQVTVVVTPTPPVVTITAPTDGAAIVVGDLLRLAGTADDAGDGDLSGGLIWESDIQGLLGTGASLIADALVPATHTITARVTDSSLLTAEASVTVQVFATTVAVPAEADTYVEQSSPDLNLGADSILMADASPDRQVFLRFPVTAGVVIDQAMLRLTISTVSGSNSELGGDVHAIADGGWSESTMTYTTRPAIDGPVIASIGPVAKGELIEIDVTPALTATESVNLALVTTTGDGVKYRSRESGSEGPTLVLHVSSSGLLDPRPSVSISMPADGTVVEEGGDVVLGAVATDPDDGDLSGAVVWTSSLAGPLGSGSPFTATGLSGGVHTIEARVSDGEGLTATSSTTLVVIAPPTVTILAPADDAIVDVSDPVTLTASAQDLEDGDVSGAVVWSSDRQGALGTGGMIAVSALVLGPHVLTATIADSDGLSAQASVSVDVLATAVEIPSAADTHVDAGDPLQNFGSDTTLAADASPERQIFLRFPVAGAAGALVERATLRLTVRGEPDAGADAGGALYVLEDTGWAEDTLTYDTRPLIGGDPLDSHGPVAPGETVEFDVTSAIVGDGPLTFVLVTSSGDGVRYRSREAPDGHPELVLDVRVPPNTAPLVSIVSPADGVEVDAGTPLTLTGTAVDLEEGNLSAGVAWTSDRDGALGTGATLAVSLSIGTHVLQATVADAEGLIGSSTATIAVVPPVMVFDVTADAFVVETVPTARFGSDTHLILKSGGPIIQGFMRFDVSGLDGRPVREAKVRLTVDVSASAGSTSGGELYLVSDASWDELLISYGNAPPIDGPLLASAGAVSASEVVEFDATAAVTGDGVYVFAIVGTVTDAVVYRSREAVGGEPQLVLLLEGE